MQFNLMGAVELFLWAECKLGQEDTYKNVPYTFSFSWQLLEAKKQYFENRTSG